MQCNYLFIPLSLHSIQPNRPRIHIESNLTFFCRQFSLIYLSVNVIFVIYYSGKLFILTLGEIYRAVVILGAAVKFYKPWILLSGASLEEIYALLEECHSLWSTSGLEEAIPAESCLEAIRHIRNLDEVAIANEVLSQEESQCGLSLLPPGVVPGVLKYTSF